MLSWGIYKFQDVSIGRGIIISCDCFCPFNVYFSDYRGVAITFDFLLSVSFLGFILSLDPVRFLNYKSNLLSKLSTFAVFA